ncbi:uncharacterized protein LOC114181546 isoform X1 [Vigna unguiculata]|uniref:uncharacterized protein LOC114181546 isoform X1 n=1 Tax=Vigna unguiculata TaxID=3917 RepID=UPI001016FB30|nr:uncharacterized protein LOC114181546 isoform X1 [Vigna unguiculata]
MCCLRLLEYTTRRMVIRVLGYFGFNKPKILFVLIGLPNSYLILLESQYLMKASRYKDFKESLQKVSGGKSTKLARQVVGSLMLLATPCDKHPSTWENHPQKLVVKDNTLTSLSCELKFNFLSEE